MKKFLFLIFLSVAGLSSVRAQQSGFASKLLADLAKSVGYTPSAAATTGTHDAGKAYGMPVIVEYDTRHTVTHIGFRLFSPEMKKAYANVIYDFLERYFLEISSWKGIIPLWQKMEDDKVMFSLGTVADIRKVTPETAFSISRTENKFYEVTWTDTKGKAFLSLAFPINYELLLGMTQEEIARTMYDRIVAAPSYTETVGKDSLELVEDGIYRTVPNAFFEVKSINTCRYFMKDDKGDYALALNRKHGDYAALNAFQTLTLCNNPILMEQSLYGFKTLRYTVTLQQWLRYCHESALTIYTAIEEEYDDGYKVIVVGECKDLGYNHLLSAIVPKNFLDVPSAEIKAKLNAFIPTHNVKNLYQQYKRKTKKKI